MLEFTFPTNSQKIDIMLLQNKDDIIKYISNIYEKKYNDLLKINNIDGIIECNNEFTSLRNSRAKPLPKKIKKPTKKCCTN